MTKQFYNFIVSMYISNYIKFHILQTKISDKYSIYFPTDVVSYIERKSTTESGHSDWKILVKMALLEVYESNIVNYSAKGTRSNKKTGIDPSVYNAILGEYRIISKI